ncbi:hypothetical protein [Oceaniglobus ichthyenteri]|uniref:hypothetical protein n=1 Tax=Oceaniglobus ichthyenteri TaxID=2136177 RepID=UPI000D36D333|nr:hypothetical protein [Oceaniglobus ichthyenteri]
MLDAMANALVCPRCNAEFEPRRSNQKFCSRSCQKNATRGKRSQEHQDRSKHHYERSRRLFEMIYKAPPSERLGVMRHILLFVPTDTGLRNILTDPALLSKPRRADHRMNIAKAADAYTKMFFGVSISTYVRKTRNGKQLEGIPVRLGS